MKIRYTHIPTENGKFAESVKFVVYVWRKLSSQPSFAVPASSSNYSVTYENYLGSRTPGLELWLSGAAKPAIDTALRGDPTVVSYSTITERNEQWLYNIDFSDEIAELFFIVVEEGGAMLAATARDGMWTLRLRFSTHEGHQLRLRAVV